MPSTDELSDYWKCPSCGSRNGKTPQQKLIQMARGSNAVIFGVPPQINCPGCHSTVSTEEFVAGRFDVDASGSSMGPAASLTPLETAGCLLALAVPVTGGILAHHLGHAWWIGALVGLVAGFLFFCIWPTKKSAPPQSKPGMPESPRHDESAEGPGQNPGLVELQKGVVSPQQWAEGHESSLPLILEAFNVDEEAKEGPGAASLGEKRQLQQLIYGLAFDSHSVELRSPAFYLAQVMKTFDDQGKTKSAHRCREKLLELTRLDGRKLLQRRDRVELVEALLAAGANAERARDLQDARKAYGFLAAISDSGSGLAKAASEALERIAQSSASAIPAEGRSSPPASAGRRPRSAADVDDGLRALARNEREEALGIWEELIRRGSVNPEPYLFLSLMHRRAKDWSRFEDAIKLSLKACELDPDWPDAWLSTGEWHVVRALEEGQRRVRGSNKLFRLDEMLREMGTWDLVLESYGKAAELDTGRLRGELASLVAKFFDKSAPLRIFDRAGEKGDRATVRTVPDLLHRAGVPSSLILPTPSDHDLLLEIERLRSAGRTVVFVPNEARMLDWQEILQGAGIPHEPTIGFRGGEERESWCKEALRNRFGFLTPWAAATPLHWGGVGTRITFLWMAAEDLSLHQFLGALSTSRDSIGTQGGLEQRWYLAKLLQNGRTT